MMWYGMVCVGMYINSEDRIKDEASQSNDAIKSRNSSSSISSSSSSSNSTILSRIFNNILNTNTKDA
jgi:hypothetical protein